MVYGGYQWFIVYVSVYVGFILWLSVCLYGCVWMCLCQGDLMCRCDSVWGFKVLCGCVYVARCVSLCQLCVRELVHVCVSVYVCVYEVIYVYVLRRVLLCDNKRVNVFVEVVCVYVRLSVGVYMR